MNWKLIPKRLIFAAILLLALGALAWLAPHLVQKRGPQTAASSTTDPVEDNGASAVNTVHFSALSDATLNSAPSPLPTAPSNWPREADPRLNRAAQSIHAFLVARDPTRNCMELSDDYSMLARERPSASPLWMWAMDRIRDCFLRRNPGLAEAEAFLRSLAELRPETADVWKNLADYYLSIGRRTEAMSAYEKAAERGPSADLLQSLAYVQRMEAEALRTSAAPTSQVARMFDAAEESYREALNVSGDQPSPWLLEGMGQLKLATGDISAALAYADQAIQSVNQQLSTASETQLFSFGLLYVNVGGIYYLSGQEEVGMAYRQQGILLVSNPEHRRILSEPQDWMTASQDSEHR